MNDVITVGIADAKIATQTETLVTYALGSCVGVCLFEPSAHIAGMVHILLPRQSEAISKNNAYKFADSGIKKLLCNMLDKGAKKGLISAKIAGGAEMFACENIKTGIGNRNVVAVKQVLHELKIPIIAEHTGKNYGRTIWFSCQDGSLKIKTVNNGVQII